MKSLIPSLALCAGLAGCAVYPAYETPYTTAVPTYDAATGTSYYQPYVYSYPPLYGSYPYAYPYAYPYSYPYWYPWFGSSWIWHGGSYRYPHGTGHGHR